MNTTLTTRWPPVPLGDVATLQRGYDLPTKSRRQGEVPIFAANGPVGTHNEVKVEGPGVVTGRSGTIGKVHYVEGGYWPLNTSLYVKDFHGNHRKFVFYLLRNMQLQRYCEGTGVPTLNRNNVHGVEIPLPPLSEQKRIADILDKADAIRRKRQQGIGELDDFPHSLFRQLFGHPDRNEKSWPMLRFDDVSESRLGKMLDAKHQTGQHPRPYMRNLNVQWGKLDMREVFEMDFNAADREQFRLQYGDVLICEGGAGVGQTAIWRDELPECYFQKSLHRVRPNPKLATPEFISFLMWTLMSGSTLLRSVSSATIPHLTGIKLKQFKIPLPPLKLQQDFAKQIEQYAKLQNQARQAKSENDNLFNALVQQAFNGEL